jgi:hypothetical protein
VYHVTIAFTKASIGMLWNSMRLYGAAVTVMTEAPVRCSAL